MNDVGLHSFLEESADSMLKIIFPKADEKILKYEQFKELIVFEEPKSNEVTIDMFFQYLQYLAEYGKGMHCS